MDPVTAAAVGQGVNVVGNLLGSLFGGRARGQANRLNQQALEQITGLSLPTVEEQEIALQQLAQQGQLTPEMLETITLGESKMTDISTDPRLRSAQMDALNALAQRGQEGLSQVEMAELNKVRNDVARDAQARNATVLQNMAQRGMAGSGAELAAQLAGNQAAAQRQSEEGDRLAAMATQRALEATMNSGNLAGQMQGRDFEQQSAIARARDEIARFNAANAQNVAQTNVGTRNLAQERNLSEAQRIADANVQLANQQQIYNKELIRQRALDQERQAAMKAAAMRARAGDRTADAQRTQDMISGTGKAIGQGITGMARPAASPAQVETQNQVDNFLSRLKPSRDLEMPELGSSRRSGSSGGFKL